MMRGWLEEVLSLLHREGRELELVIVSVTCVSNVEIGWEVKRQLLAPLSKLVPRLKFAVGEVEADDEVQTGLRRWVREHVNELNAMRV